MHGEIDNPMTDERFDPKPKLTEDNRPDIEVVFTATITRKITVKQPLSRGQLLDPGDLYFFASLDDADIDKVCDTMTEAMREDGYDRCEAGT